MIPRDDERASRRLFWRIFVALLAGSLFTAALGAGAVAIYHRDARADLMTSSLELFEAAPWPDDGSDVHTPAWREALKAISNRQAHVGLYGPEGELVAGEGLPRLPRRRLERARRRASWARGRPLRFNEPRRPPIVVWAVLDPNGEVAAFVAFAAKPSPWLFVAVLVSFLLGLGLVAGLLARSFSARIDPLTRGAVAMTEGDLSVRIPVRNPDRPDALDALTSRFNQMAESVEAGMRRQKVLLTNVSHELRTPLARLRVMTELLQERGERLNPEDATAAQRFFDGLRDLDRDVVEIAELVDAMLVVGRLDLGGREQLKREPVELHALVDRELRAADGSHRSGEAVLDADALLLRRLVANLVANATRAGGPVTASIESDAAGVCLHVEDHGPGIPEQAREQVFEPFTRLDDARSRDAGGAGLGLFLCRQIATAHGGTLTAHGRRDGQSGACLTLKLPAGQAEPAHGQPPRPSLE